MYLVHALVLAANIASRRLFLARYCCLYVHNNCKYLRLLVELAALALYEYRIALKFGGSKNSRIVVFERFVEIISRIRSPYPRINEFMGGACLSYTMRTDLQEALVKALVANGR